MRKKLLSLFLIFSMMISFFMPNRIFAYQDISDYVITELKIDKTDVNAGENIRVSLKFKEPNNYSIKNGDEIKVTWKKRGDGDSYLEGYSTIKPLYVREKQVGELTVTIDSATIRFNSNIDKLEDVEGGAEFTLKSLNYYQGHDGNIGNAYVKAGRFTKDVNIKKYASGLRGVFYDKVGYIQPEDINYVNWGLHINTNKDYVEEGIIIDDNIKSGQVLDENSFNITLIDYNEQRFYFTKDEFLARYPESKIDIINGNHIKIYIPSKYLSKIYIFIGYKTNILDKDQVEFVNETTASYKVYGEDRVNNEQVNKTVQNIRYLAYITGIVKGELKVVKKLEDEEKAIPSVIFELKREDNKDIKDGEKILKLTTNQEGIANVKGLPEGRYILKEIQAPNWIDFSPEQAKEIRFEIHQDDTLGKVFIVRNKAKEITPTAQPTPPTIVPETLDLNIKKYWQDINNNYINNDKDEIEVELYRDNVATGKRIKLNKSTNWEGKFEKLPLKENKNSKPYNYTIKEVGENGGKISINGKKYEVTIKGEKLKGFEIINKLIEDKPKPPLTSSVTKKTIDINIIKEWQDENGNITENILEEIEVELYRDNVATGNKIKLDKNSNWEGKFEFLPLTENASSKPYNYTIKEVGENSGKISINKNLYEVKIIKQSENNYKLINKKIKHILEKPSSDSFKDLNSNTSSNNSNSNFNNDNYVDISFSKGNSVIIPPIKEEKVPINTDLIYHPKEEINILKLNKEEIKTEITTENTTISNIKTTEKKLKDPKESQKKQKELPKTGDGLISIHKSIILFIIGALFLIFGYRLKVKKGKINEI